jgi:hypothetical protein
VTQNAKKILPMVVALMVLLIGRVACAQECPQIAGLYFAGHETLLIHQHECHIFAHQVTSCCDHDISGDWNHDAFDYTVHRKDKTGCAVDMKGHLRVISQHRLESIIEDAQGCGEKIGPDPATFQHRTWKKRRSNPA